MVTDVLIRKMYLPGDTNHMGKVFGGAVLADIDVAGAIAAMRVITNPEARNVVTRSMKEVEFLLPVEVGEVITFRLISVRMGTTSIRVTLEVQSSGIHTDDACHVTAAEIVYVAVDAQGRKVKVKKDDA